MKKTLKICSQLLFLWAMLCMPICAFAYELTEQDKALIQNAEQKIDTFFESYPGIWKQNVMRVFEKKAQELQDERISEITKKLIDYISSVSYTHKITVLEWWNIFDIDDYLTRKKLIRSGEYISYVENREKIIALSKFFPFLDSQMTLEWYLYPDTYEISAWKLKVNTLVIQQLEAFEEKVCVPLFQDRYINSVTESVINLASIVEKEEKNEAEKAKVAGILKKRVKEYWHIWADATACYAYKINSQKCKNNLSQYIGEKNQYNTRFIIGLPPTPISNPNYETIHATLNHEVSPYYYYLHDTSTGKIYYAETNEEHAKNKQLYIK